MNISPALQPSRAHTYKFIQSRQTDEKVDKRRQSNTSACHRVLSASQEGFLSQILVCEVKGISKVVIITRSVPIHIDGCSICVHVASESSQLVQLLHHTVFCQPARFTARLEGKHRVENRSHTSPL